MSMSIFRDGFSQFVFFIGLFLSLLLAIIWCRSYLLPNEYTLISMNELRINFHVLKYSIEFPFGNCSFSPLDSLLSLSLPIVRLHSLAQTTSMVAVALNLLSIKFQLVQRNGAVWMWMWMWRIKWFAFNRKLRNNEQAQNKTKPEQNRTEPKQLEFEFLN